MFTPRVFPVTSSARTTCSQNSCIPHSPSRPPSGFRFMVPMADDYLVKIPSFVRGAPAPIPFLSTLPILLGTTPKGGSLVVYIPGVESRQLRTERRVRVKATGHEVVSSSPFDPPVCPTRSKTLQVARELSCEHICTVDRLSIY